MSRIVSGFIFLVFSPAASARNLPSVAKDEKNKDVYATHRTIGIHSHRHPLALKEKDIAVITLTELKSKICKHRYHLQHESPCCVGYTNLSIGGPKMSGNFVHRKLFI